MALQFSTTNKAPHKLSFLLFGEGGVGKTWLVKTLEVADDSEILYVAADPGDLTLISRTFCRVRAEDGDWSAQDLNLLLDHIRASKAYRWIVVDGLDEIGESVVRTLQRRQRDGRKAYGEMAELMAAWTKTLRDFKHVSTLFITHIGESQDDQQRLYFRPEFPGRQVTDRLINWFDVVGAMRWVQQAQGEPSRRLVQFSREVDDRFRVKDRTGALLPFEEPNLGNIMKKIEAALSKEAKKADPPAERIPWGEAWKAVLVLLDARARLEKPGPEIGEVGAKAVLEAIRAKGWDRHSAEDILRAECGLESLAAIPHDRDKKRDSVFLKIRYLFTSYSRDEIEAPPSELFAGASATAGEVVQDAAAEPASEPVAASPSPTPGSTGGEPEQQQLLPVGGSAHV